MKVDRKTPRAENYVAANGKTYTIPARANILIENGRYNYLVVYVKKMGQYLFMWTDEDAVRFLEWAHKEGMLPLV